MLEEQGVVTAGDGGRWLKRAEKKTLDALEDREQATARELTAVVPELRAKLHFGEGTTWAGSVGVSTRVLFLLAAEGRVVRGRPLGTWTSGQYRWSRIETWLGRALPSIDRADACAELLGRWLRAVGPGTTTDIRWWMGWTAKLTSETLRAIEAVEVELDEGTGWALPDDLEPVERPEPWVALLPGLDSTVMGWKDRAWYLGEHGAELFDRNGNAGPTVWANGRVVGGWAQADDGEIVVELLEPVDARTNRRIERERDRLREWFGDVRIKARFPAPHERRLAARTGAG
jgi:hypothetical protein